MKKRGKVIRLPVARRAGLLAGDRPLVYVAFTKRGQVAFGVRTPGSSLRQARLEAQREYTALAQYVAQHTAQLKEDEALGRLQRSVRALTKRNGET